MRKTSRTGNTWRGDPVAKRGFALWIIAYAVLVLVLGIAQGASSKGDSAGAIDPAFTATVTPAAPAR